MQALREQVQSSYYRVAPNTAWSPMRSAQSLSKFFVITGFATTTAWFSHPYLLNLAAHVLHLDFKDSVTAFQTSFFSFLSLVFAIYSGNTMAFLYERQKAMVQNLYAECMALEELLEESVNTLGPDARDILAQIRVYIDTEIYSPENQSPPLGDGYALSIIRSKARNYRRAGTDVGEILQASQRLAHAQSERQATACRLLPPVHWALLYTIGSLFVSTFILFETGGSFSNEGRHILFTVLCGLMSFVLVALRDLADPAEGVYNATALLETRLSYVKMMLDKYQKLPSSRPGMTPAATLAVPAPSEEVSSNTLLNRAVTAIQDGIKDLSPAQEAEAYEAVKAESSKQEKDHGPEHSNGSRLRPVLEAKLQVSTPEVNGKANGVSPVLAVGGVTATMGSRMAGNASDKPYPGVPHLQGLPENAQQSGVHRLVGVSNAIVTRPRKASEQVQRQLGSRLLLREPQYQSQAVVSAGKAKSQ